MSRTNLDGRRGFIKKSTSAALGGVLLSTFPSTSYAYSYGAQTLKIGLVGCGGRGTGALFEALKASSSVRVVAIADTFEDRATKVLSMLKQSFDDQCDVTRETMFVGFDAYEKVIELSDVVILATPPPFRPQHFETSIKAGKLYRLIQRPEPHWHGCRARRATSALWSMVSAVFCLF